MWCALYIIASTDIHFICEQVKRGKVHVLRALSCYHIAYIFTKGLPRVLFDDFQDSLNIRQPPAAGV